MEEIAEKPAIKNTVTMPAKAYDTIMSFIAAVANMRAAQKRQFNGGNKPVDIKTAKEHEADVDAYLADSIFRSPVEVPTQDSGLKTQDSFNEDTIGQLIQAKVKHINLIQQKEEQLQGITDHQSDAATQLFEDIQELKYDLTSIEQALISEKEKHKAFLQTRLTQYRHELHDNMKPHEQEELSNLINATVRKIDELDREIKSMKA